MKLPDLAPVRADVLSIAKRLDDTIQAEYALARGAGQLVGSVTLTPSAATTVVTKEGLPVGALIFLTAQTANAAAEAGGTALYVAPVSTAGQFTIAHVNSVTTGRTFSWAARVPS